MRRSSHVTATLSMSLSVSDVERKFVLSALREGLRVDGRQMREMREVRALRRGGDSGRGAWGRTPSVVACPQLSIRCERAGGEACVEVCLGETRCDARARACVPLGAGDVRDRRRPVVGPRRRGLLAGRLRWSPRT